MASLSSPVMNMTGSDSPDCVNCRFSSIPTPTVQIDVEEKARGVVQGSLPQELFHGVVDLGGEPLRLQHPLDGAENAGVIIEDDYPSLHSHNKVARSLPPYHSNVGWGLTVLVHLPRTQAPFPGLSIADAPFAEASMPRRSAIITSSATEVAWSFSIKL